MHPMERKPLRVAFLIGSDALPTIMSMQAVCRLDGVQPVAALMDTARPPLSRRVKNLIRNIRREGIGYVSYRMLLAASDILNRYADRLIPRRQVFELLHKAFPDRAFTLEDVAARYGFRVVEVGNLNGPQAIAALRECAPDLGVVLGTRILRRPTFSVPSLGCINLHKGKVPEFRGLPPGFWELYEGSRTAGVTVHFVDAGLDTGDIIGAADIPIHPNETEVSLRTKLDVEGTRLLAECVGRIEAGTAVGAPQLASAIKPRTKPTRAQRKELARRRPGAVCERRLPKEILKTSLYLALYHLGVYEWVRWRRKKASRAAILLYHRVNDYSSDSLSASTTAFAEHLALLQNRYQVRKTNWLIDRLRGKETIPPRTVVIHFDDCYRDVFTHAGPLLKAAGMPATSFISSGFIGANRAFEHDLQSPFRFENLRPEEVAEFHKWGIDVGAHTINHVNLGKTQADEARSEVLGSRSRLEALTGGPVRMFSFPFGKMENIREEVREIIREARFDALFSAYGGFVSAAAAADLYDVPRMGVSAEHRPLDLMMELEGISLRDLFR
jgi:peptidoglycan/xylan/chitin deacetylase (PgdA/CDA1 family)